MSTYDKYLNLLKQIIQLKSVSTDHSFKDECALTAKWLNELFNDNGFETKIHEGYGNPIVVASYVADESFETCLIYGHYDVQPAEKEDGWNHDPFDVYEENGRLYARGVVDNKGQVLIHIANIIDLIKDGKLAYNVKFMIEGDEETGSPKLPDFIKEHKADLACDFFLISDGEIISDNPVIDAGFRGGANTKLVIKTASTDLHSGLFGGVAPSAAHEAAKFVANLKDSNNQVTIPGFYDDVDSISDEILENNKNIPFDMDEITNITGIKALKNEEGVDYYSQVGLRPTIEVTGLDSGFTDEGYRNSIPALATVKVNFRLVKNQNPNEVIEKYKQYIASVMPEYVEWDLQVTDPYEASKMNLDNKYVQIVKDKLTKSFGKAPYLAFSGGGLPIVILYQKYLGTDGVLAGLGNADCNMHGTNENYNIDILKKGLEFSRLFFSK
ncbi:MAG: M20/M25/M40 family metallo-hydrolase [Candidatus Dojkabacteria bacterium]|nr:M20/M25/M40 family metallo-hydrolase [Candidatus Dojkabacteria bacterium]MDQ7020304.1 M20/M25/M40 family metallo-hydrolase [Candidatus Dojkabacteria bacterium]